MMVLVLEDDLKLILVTFRWCQSSTMLLMIVPIFDFSALIPASSISSVIFSMVYRLIIHVSVVISRTTVPFVYSSFWPCLVLWPCHSSESPQGKRGPRMYKFMKHIIFSLFRLLLVTFARMYLYPCPHQRLFLVTFTGMYSYFWMWRMYIDATQWTFLTFCFCVPSLWPHFIPFPLSPLHLESKLLGVKDLLFILLGFPRHASLRDRSPESSETYVTLDSWSSLIRTTFGVRTSFFPGSHLRVSRTPKTLGLLEKLSQRYAVPRDETTCAWFHLQRD